MALKLHTLLFKTVNYCNLACDYCYARRFHEGHTPTIISNEVVNRAISDYIELAEEGRGTGPDGQWMVFLWHGGEPTLAGIDFYEEVVRTQKCTKRADYMINSITSNGTLIDDSWIALFRENDFRVSISIDGPQHLHDIHRLSCSGSSCFKSVTQSIDLLQRNQIPFGVMCVITEESVHQAEDIFKFFVELGLKKLNFLPRISSNSWLPTVEYANFMARVFDLWIEHDDPSIYIRELENIIHELLGGRAELCEFNGCCGSYLAIDNTGDVYLCDLFIGYESMKVGNILTDSLKEILDSSETRRKVNSKIDIHHECSDCLYLPICKGGCLYRRTLPRGKYSDKDFYCEYRKAIINHITLGLSEIFSSLPREELSPLLAEQGKSIV